MSDPIDQDVVLLLVVGVIGAGLLGLLIGLIWYLS